MRSSTKSTPNTRKSTAAASNSANVVVVIDDDNNQNHNHNTSGDNTTGTAVGNNSNNNNNNNTPTTAVSKTQYKSLLLGLSDADIQDLWKIRRTVIEMLYDGGFDVDASRQQLSIHPNLPVELDEKPFAEFIHQKIARKPMEHQAISKQLLQIQAKIRAERKPIKDKIKILGDRMKKVNSSELKHKIKEEQKTLYLQMESMHKDELDEITYNLLTEHDLSICTTRRPLNARDESAFQLWMNQDQQQQQQPRLEPLEPVQRQRRQRARMELDTDTANDDKNHTLPSSLDTNDPANKIVVFFCNEARIGKEPFQFYVKRMRTMKVRNAILVSREGCTSTIEKSLIPKHSDYHIRIFSYKQLIVNLIRYHCYVPRYQLLQPTQVEIVEKRYGDVNCFPKLKKSRPVAKYYGFNTGDVVAVSFTGKGYCTESDTHLQNFIYPVSFKVIIEE